jgi:hypothetical protein
MHAVVKCMGLAEGDVCDKDLKLVDGVCTEPEPECGVKGKVSWAEDNCVTSTPRQR